jgi:hypothetical protein
MIRFDRMAKSNEDIFDIWPLEGRVKRERILAMERSTVIKFDDRKTRESRISRAMDARRRLRESEPEVERTPGRAWINGVEVGGTDRRFAHLSTFHD